MTLKIKKELVSTKYFMPIVSKAINDNKIVEMIVSGNSMKPLLIDHKSIVRLKKVDNLKKGNIVLYKKNKQYILHRIVNIQEKYYEVSGDNGFKIDEITKEDIIGVVTKFSRYGKYWRKRDNLYQIFLLIIKKLKQII